MSTDEKPRTYPITWDVTHHDPPVPMPTGSEGCCDSLLSVPMEHVEGGDLLDGIAAISFVGITGHEQRLFTEVELAAVWVQLARHLSEELPGDSLIRPLCAGVTGAMTKLAGMVARQDAERCAKTN